MSTATATREIAMPRLSDSMEEAVVLAWLKAEGDEVRVGEPLVEIETDKATMVYEAEVDGVLAKLLVAAGDTVVLGAPIALLAGAGEAEGASVPEDAGPADEPAPRPGRIRATPVARRAAAEFGVDLAVLSGSGPGGRIVRTDVLAAAPAAPAPGAATSAPEPVAGARRELTATQRTIARRMAASRSEIPDFTVTFEIDVTAALALRRELNEALSGARISINDLIVRAAALTLREQPALNSWWVGDAIVRQPRVRIGIAVASDDGALLVPAIDDPDRKSLVEIARDSRAAGERARARSCGAEELGGATFTVSNLGMFGALAFEAVIDPPQVAILAVGAAVRRPCFDADGTVVARDLLQVSLCSDHRAVYGADAARFLARFRELLEQPLLLTQPALPASEEETSR